MKTVNWIDNFSYKNRSCIDSKNVPLIEQPSTNKAEEDFDVIAIDGDIGSEDHEFMIKAGEMLYFDRYEKLIK